MLKTKFIAPTLLLTAASGVIPLSVLAQQNDTVNIITNNTNFNFVRGLTPDLYSRSAINIIFGVAGIAAFIFLLWGGLQWITAGSDKDAVEKARKRITQALVGLAVVFSAYAIIFILRVLFNVNLLGFTLGPLGN